MTEPSDEVDPLHAFRFIVDFHDSARSSDQALCRGGFSEVSGLEATMEPVAISEGGFNYGQVQRAGRTTFSTVILRRGMTTTRHLWQWFSHVNMTGKYAHRLHVTVTMCDLANTPVVRWTLREALPVKLKLADLNATAQEVAIEELHLVHEELSEETVSGAASPGGAP
jgi:phage tail-like protein